MKTIKVICIIAFLICSTSLRAQNVIIKPPEGFEPQIGNLIAMMDDLKGRITNIVKDLDQQQVDFLLDDEANRIGAMILHLAATEKIYQNLTFEHREFNEAEEAEWGAAMSLGDQGREELKGQPISFYLEKWDQVREKTKEMMKGQTDDWLNEVREDEGYTYNHHWMWYHVMEHQSNHMGQIVLIKKRLPENNK